MDLVLPKIKVRGGRRVPAWKKNRTALEVKMQIARKTKLGDFTYIDEISTMPDEETWRARMRLKELDQKRRAKTRLVRFEEDMKYFGRNYISATWEDRLHPIKTMALIHKKEHIQEERDILEEKIQLMEELLEKHNTLTSPELDEIMEECMPRNRIEDEEGSVLDISLSDDDRFVIEF